jgi:hypothetical protein
MDAGQSGSRLEQILRSGTFSVTAELETTDSARPESIREVAEPLFGHVDGINCTDNSAAHPHISQTAAARLLLDLGQEPIMQQACRDRNRLALQADLLGAAALGVRNFTMMTGDDVSAGDWRLLGNKVSARDLAVAAMTPPNAQRVLILVWTFVCMFFIIVLWFVVFVVGVIQKVSALISRGFKGFQAAFPRRGFSS